VMESPLTSIVGKCKFSLKNTTEFISINI
jgi:hypothetical protein